MFIFSTNYVSSKWNSKNDKVLYFYEVIKDFNDLDFTTNHFELRYLEVDDYENVKEIDDALYLLGILLSHSGINLTSETINKIGKLILDQIEYDKVVKSTEEDN